LASWLLAMTLDRMWWMCSIIGRIRVRIKYGVPNGTKFRPPDIPLRSAAFLPVSPKDGAAKVMSGFFVRDWSGESQNSAFSRVFGSIVADSSEQNRSHSSDPLSGGLKLRR